MEASAILLQKLYAHLSEHAFDQGNRVLGSRVATHLNIRDRVSMQTGSLSPSPQPPNSAHRAPSEFVRLSQARGCAVVTCNKATTRIALSPNQGGIQ